MILQVRSPVFLAKLHESAGSQGEGENLAPRLENRRGRATVDRATGWIFQPISMTDPWDDCIFTYTCTHKNQLNVGKYTIHGSYMGLGNVWKCGNPWVSSHGKWVTLNLTCLGVFIKIYY